MTSYVVNPSKKVTEILSEFLEFDPDQLQLGIWSGDLSIKDVSLKREAIQSLFAQKLQQSTCGKDLLKLSLIKGQIGHMRIQIPWKRLVWGSGDVRLTISDVDIVLAFEKCCPDQKTSEESGDNEELPETTRERKQSCLQEAERLQLQGLPIPRVFESFQDQSYPELSDSPDSKQKQQEPQINNPAGRLDSWMKQATSSIVWRFFAGLQATIRNVRVVIVQDGVEVGLIQHSMNVVATHNAHDGEHATETTQQTSDNSNQPSEFGGDEAGEHVDKTVDVQGFAVFIREIPTNPLLVSPQLKFSSSVNADDYILRPTNSKLSFSFFYPHPPGTPKKRKQPADDTATRASEDGSKTTTSKTRRGKRDKRSNKQQQEYMQPLKLHRVASEAGVSVFDKPSNLRRSTVFTPEGGGSDALVPDMSELIRQDQTKRQHHRRIASGSKMSGNKTSYSTAETSAKSALPTVMEQDHSPHVDLHLAFGEIKTVFSSKHYNLVLMMVSFIKRMQNGRPDKSIGEFLDDDESDKAKSIVVDVSPDTPDAFPVPAPFSAKSTSLAATTPNIPPPLHNFPPPPPSAPLIRYHSDFVMARKTRKQVHLSLQLQPKLRSAKSRVIKEWWEYAYRIVSKEVSKKRQEKAHFCGSTFHFSWNAQKRRRQEYINLYISNRLEKSSVLHHMEFHALPSVRQAEETLLQIEDELPIEQILLYRSIARALRVQGRKSMPYSVLSFRQDQRGLTRQSSLGTQQAPSTSHKRTKRRGSAFQRAQDNGTAMKSAASSIGLEKDPAALGELKRLCSEARVRRGTESGNDSAKQPPTPANLFSPLSTKTLGKRRLFREDSDRHVNFGLNRKSSFGTMDAARMSSEDLDSSIRGTPVKTVVASDDKTFTYRTAKSSSSNTNFSNTVPVQSNTAVQVRFSFALKVEQLELLVFSDENYLRMVRGQQDFSDFSSSATAGSRESKLQLQPNLHLFADGDSSDGISDISASSEEAEFFESNDANISFVEAESDDHPILSSNDFLTFGLPNDVILKVSISPLSFSHRGLSGGAKKFSFGIGSVIATGEHALKLLSIGTCDPKSFHEGHFLNPFEEIQLRKKSFNATNMKHSIGNFSVRPNDEALKASLVQLENGKSFLEVDIAKIVATAEIKAILSIQTFVSETVVLLPKPMLGRTEIDEVRDYVLQRSQTPKPFFLDQFNCAFRLHGIDVTVPNGVLEPNEGGGESENGEKVDSRPKMKAVVRLVEYYNGRLVDHIVSVSQESMGDDATKYSSAMKSRVSAQSSVDWGGAFVSDGRMKLLDLSELMKKHDSLTSNHSVS